MGDRADLSILYDCFTTQSTLGSSRGIRLSILYDCFLSVMDASFADSLETFNSLRLLQQPDGVEAKPLALPFQFFTIASRLEDPVLPETTRYRLSILYDCFWFDENPYIDTHKIYFQFFTIASPGLKGLWTTR